MMVSTSPLTCTYQATNCVLFGYRDLSIKIIKIVPLTQCLSKSRMHRALVVLDIIQEIFAHLRSPSSWLHLEEKRLCWKDLAALARTCKAFHEPAMDLLWKNMHGICPLLGCVPRLHPLIYRFSEVSVASQTSEPLRPSTHLINLNAALWDLVSGCWTIIQA